MDERIQVLNIGIDNCTSKEAMKRTVSYMGTEAISVVEMATVDVLMHAAGDPDLRRDIEDMDLVLPGEKEILGEVLPSDKRKIQEIEQRTYQKMFFRFLHKNHLRVFLLVETEAEAESFLEFLEDRYSGIQVAGMAKISPADTADDMVVNAVNGAETDCILSVLASPEQERFIMRNRKLLNARVWLGMGAVENPVYRSRTRRDRLFRFINHKLFKREIEKNRKKEMSAAGV